MTQDARTAPLLPGLEPAAVPCGRARVRARLAAAFAAEDGLDRVAVVALYVFAFGYVGGKALANLGLAAVVGAWAVAVVRDRRLLRGDPMLGLALAWTVYVCGLCMARAFGWLPGKVEGPRLETLSFAFVPMLAWAMRGSAVRVATVLLLALAGVLFKLAQDLDLGAWPPFPYGIDFPYMMGVNRNISSLMLNTAILGVGLWGLRRWVGSGGSRDRLLRTLPMLPLLAFLGLAYATSPSRTLWLALGAAVLVLLFHGRSGRRRWVALGIFALVASAVAAALELASPTPVLLKETSIVRLMVTGDWGAIPIDESSTGMRSHMWRLSILHLAQGPWLVGVVNSGSEVLRANPGHLFSGFAQVHNGYLEILLRTGLIGLGFHVAAVALFVRAAAAARAAGRMPFGLGRGLLGALVIFLVVNVTNGVITFQHGWQFVVLAGALACTWRWPAPVRREAA